MPASLGPAYRHTLTAKLPLIHYARGTTYVWAGLFIAINLAFGKWLKLLEVIVGQIVLIYLPLGGMGELYFHNNIMAKDSAAVKQARIQQSIAEIGECQSICQTIDAIFSFTFNFSRCSC